MPGGTVSPAKFDQFRELHAQGLGRNAIAREMGIAPVTASRTAVHLGLDFDRTKMREAQAARVADLEERRSLLASELLDIAEDSLKRIYQPTTVYSFGGKDNSFNDHEFPEAPVAERVKYMTSAAIAIDKSLKLVPPEVATGGTDDAKSMLGKLFTGIAELVNQGDETPAEGE